MIGNDERSNAHIPNLSSKRKQSVRTCRGMVNGDGFSSEFGVDDICGDSNLFK